MSVSPTALDFRCSLAPPLWQVISESKRTRASKLRLSLRRCASRIGRSPGLSSDGNIQFSSMVEIVSFQRMSFGIENNSIEVKRFGWSKQQIEIFESLSEQKTLHRVGFFFGNHAFERRIAFVGTAILDEVSPHSLSQPQVLRI